MYVTNIIINKIYEKNVLYKKKTINPIIKNKLSSISINCMIDIVKRRKDLYLLKVSRS